MKLAIIGLNNLQISDIGMYIPSQTSEIVLGGTDSISVTAAEYAKNMNIPVSEFLPMYSVYGRKAVKRRNDFIMTYADEALIFWDGRSRKIKTAIEIFEAAGKPVRAIICEEKQNYL